VILNILFLASYFDAMIVSPCIYAEADVYSWNGQLCYYKYWNINLPDVKQKVWANA